MLIKLLTPRLLVTASVLLAVTVGVRAPRTPIIKKRPGNPGTPDRLPPGPKDSGTQDYSPYKTVHDHYFPPTDTYDREHIHPPNPPRDSNTYTDPGFIFSPPNLPQRPGNPGTPDRLPPRHRDFGTHDYSPPVELQSPGEQEYPLTDTYDVNINNLHDDIIEVQPLTNEEFKILLHDNLRLPLHVFLEYLHRYAFYRKQKFKGPRDFGTHDHSSTANNTRHDDNGKASLPIQQPEGNYAKFLEDINVAYQEMYLNKTRHDDIDKTSLPIQQPKSQSKKLLFNRMLYKIIDSLRKLANETIVVRELLKGDIPREDESKNSSEPIQNCTHHIEQIQKRMTSFKDLQKSVLDSIVDFEQAYDILRESWNTKLENMISSPNSFLRMIGVRPLREKIRTEDKLYDSSKPATTLRQALAQLYIQDHVKLEISNCTHQIDHFQKQMRLFEAQQIKVYDSITKLKYEYKLLIESWETELKNVIDRNVPIEKVYKKVYKDIQLLRSTDHEQEIIMEDTEKLDELQVSSELAMPLEKLPKRLIFLTDPFKWKHNIWQFQSNELRKSDNLTGDLKQNKWLIFKQIDPQLKRWRLVATTVPETTFGEAQGRVEPTNLGSPIMVIKRRYLNSYVFSS